MSSILVYGQTTHRTKFLMFYETYLKEEPDLMYEIIDDLESHEDTEDEYRQNRMEEMVSRFGGN